MEPRCAGLKLLDLRFRYGNFEVKLGRYSDRIIVQKIADWLGKPPKTGGLLDLPELGVCFSTSLGLVRQENQDKVVSVRYSSPKAEESFFLLAIADGMGGMKDGGGCASQALSALIVSLASNGQSGHSRGLLDAVHEANNEVYEKYQERGGTTLNVILLTRRGITAASVGDSRLYSFSNGGLKQISEDDSIGAELGRIRPDLHRTMDIGGFAQHLTQYIGMGKGLEPHIYTQLSDDQSFLFTTDGVHRLPHPVLQDLVSTAKNNAELANRMIQVANWTGGRDNASVALLSTRSPAWTSKLVVPAESPTLEMWDCFGKYEIIRDQFPSSPAMPASGDYPRHISQEQDHLSSAPKSATKKKRETKHRQKPRSSGEVQISLVDQIDQTLPPSKQSALNSEDTGLPEAAPSHADFSSSQSPNLEKPDVDSAASDPQSEKTITHPDADVSNRS